MIYRFFEWLFEDEKHVLAVGIPIIILEIIVLYFMHR